MKFSSVLNIIICFFIVGLNESIPVRVGDLRVTYSIKTYEDKFEEISKYRLPSDIQTINLQPNNKGPKKGIIQLKDDLDYILNIKLTPDSVALLSGLTPNPTPAQMTASLAGTVKSVSYSGLKFAGIEVPILLKMEFRNKIWCIPTIPSKFTVGPNTRVSSDMIKLDEQVWDCFSEESIPAPILADKRFEKSVMQTRFGPYEKYRYSLYVPTAGYSYPEKDGKLRVHLWREGLEARELTDNDTKNYFHKIVIKDKLIGVDYTKQIFLRKKVEADMDYNVELSKIDRQKRVAALVDGFSSIILLELCKNGDYDYFWKIASLKGFQPDADAILQVDQEKALDPNFLPPIKEESDEGSDSEVTTIGNLPTLEVLTEFSSMPNTPDSVASSSSST